MSSPKGRIFRLLGGAFLHAARVTATRIDGGFAWIDLASDALRAAKPGDKVQLLLPGDDVRTYTPVPDGRNTRLLVHLHGDTPGPRWARSVQVGDVLRFKGPDRSLTLPDGPAVIVGDATSIAVALAYRATAWIEGVDFEGMHRLENLDAIDLPAGAAVGVTGGAPLVQRARAALRRRGVEPRVKTYWAPGRVGLD